MTDPKGSQRLIIVGAGLGGSLLACFLGRRGYRVDVYEARPDPRAAGFAGGRSINLALSTRGIHALQQVGLAEDVLANVIPMHGRMIHPAHGSLAFQPYSRNPDDAINSASRGGLNIALINAAAAMESVAFHFQHRCVDIDLDTPSCTFEHAGGSTTTAQADVIFGCDGAYSAVRSVLQTSGRFNYQQEYLDHGYKELTIPPSQSGDFALEPNALHIWPRGGFMMIALPNQDRSFTCTIFWPWSGPNGFDSINSHDEIVDFFTRQFPDAVPLMPTLVEDYQNNPTGTLVTIRCSPYHHRDNVLLLGDAAHAVVPFYGQGMNAAFEDCAILDELIDEHRGRWDEILPRFSAARKADADAIADMAKDNFIEMRDKVGSRLFLLQKKLEKLLHATVPGYLPLYNMVTFTRIPYSEARRRAKRQDVIIAVIAGAVMLLLLLLLLLALLAVM